MEDGTGWDLKEKKYGMMTMTEMGRGISCNGMEGEGDEMELFAI